ncbi:MAG: proline dehydrogenase 1 [Candidatus Micrarchaeota archaeon]|nr:MAG: proline dehydrogenase 1 [Candidatus Micrarchaeota archaeon]
MNELLEGLIAKKWIPGPRLEDAIRVAKELNKDNIVAMINFIGEHIKDTDKVDSNVNEYLKIIDAIRKEKLKAVISLKPSQIGLDLSYKLALSNLKSILNKAYKSNIEVWLDMEEYDTVDKTIRLFKELYSSSNRELFGICIQSYLRRSLDDIIRLSKIKARIRLVKGAYKPSNKEEFYISRDDVTKSYYKLLDYLFKHNDNFIVATHDSNIIDYTIKQNKKLKRRVSFAMLYGIRDRLAKELAIDNKVYLYLPYGKDWIPYTTRRIKEGVNLKLIIRSIFSR